MKLKYVLAKAIQLIYFLGGKMQEIEERQE